VRKILNCLSFQPEQFYLPPAFLASGDISLQLCFWPPRPIALAFTLRLADNIFSSRSLHVACADIQPAMPVPLPRKRRASSSSVRISSLRLSSPSDDFFPRYLEVDHQGQKTGIRRISKPKGCIKSSCQFPTQLFQPKKTALFKEAAFLAFVPIINSAQFIWLFQSQYDETSPWPAYGSIDAGFKLQPFSTPRSHQTLGLPHPLGLSALSRRQVQCPMAFCALRQSLVPYEALLPQTASLSRCASSRSLMIPIHADFKNVARRGKATFDISSKEAHQT